MKIKSSPEGDGELPKQGISGPKTVSWLLKKNTHKKTMKVKIGNLAERKAINLHSISNKNLLQEWKWHKGISDIQDGKN